MKKAKIMLITIVVVAITGGALAFKASTLAILIFALLQTMPQDNVNLAQCLLRQSLRPLTRISFTKV